MVDQDLALLLKYPLINCEIYDGIKNYNGIITIEYQDYKLDILQECKTGIEQFTLKNKFGYDIDNSITEINATNIIDYLDNVSSILETHFQENNPKNYVNVYRKVLSDYSEFVKFHLKIRKSELSADLSTINATTTDDSGREHSVKIQIDFDEPKNIYSLHNLNLPEQICKDLSKKFSNLTEAYGRFLNVIDGFQPFFDALDDLDRNCCILDPEKPTWKACYRRIYLDKNLSVVVTIDLANVRARPDLKFLGPQHLVMQYFDKINDKLDTWDEDDNLVQGLLNMLEIESFPKNVESNQEILIDYGECNICFSSRFNNKLPEVICSNKSCEKFYHVDCLYEWLTSVTSKRIFNEICGLCPNCEKRIVCPLPDVDSSS